MRLAIIDYKTASNSLKERLKYKGVSADIAKSIEEFEQRYGSLEGYDGLLLHPSLEKWRSYLTEIPKKYHGLKYAIASYGIADYMDSTGLRAFDFEDSEGIFEYFFGEIAEKAISRV